MLKNQNGKITFSSTIVKDKIDIWTNICLKEDVHAYGGMYYAFSNNDVVCMSVCLYGNKIIGCAILTEKLMFKDFNFGVYVKKDFRRKGIGSELTRAIRKRSKEILKVDYACNCDFFDNFNFLEKIY